MVVHTETGLKGKGHTEQSVGYNIIVFKAAHPEKDECPVLNCDTSAVVESK